MVFVCCIGVLVVLGILAFVARDGPGDIFRRMSGFLYDVCCLHGLPVVDAKKVRGDLERLYPGGDMSELKKNYYVEKLRLAMLVVFVGTLLCVLLQAKLLLEETVSRTGVIEREEAGGGEREVLLEATVSGETTEFSVEVPERKLNQEELARLFEKCALELERLVLGDAYETGQVSENLELVESMEGYPFEIVWQSSDYMLVSRSGKVTYDEESSSQEVELTAYLYYGEEVYEHRMKVQIVRGEQEQEDLLEKKLLQAIAEKDAQSQYEEALPLPTEVEGQKVSWKEIKEDNTLLFFVLTIAAAVGVYFLKDKDLHDALLEKKKSMRMSYPIILNKFVLYMGAGMTVRGSFIKIALDYQSHEADKPENAAYEEMLYSCNELSAGISEGLVYERFGRRSGLQEYARFATMLSQNLKKGNSALLSRLREESEKAQIENLQYRKKLGEEAETKLLVPMIMMMGIVMLLVMIPAFSSFE